MMNTFLKCSIFIVVTIIAALAYGEYAKASDRWYGPKQSGEWRTVGTFVKGNTQTHAWCTTHTNFRGSSGNIVGTFSIGIRVSDWMHSNDGALSTVNIYWPNLPLLASGPEKLGGWAIARVGRKTIQLGDFTYDVLNGTTLSVEVNKDFVENVFRKGSWLKLYVTNGRRSFWLKLDLRGTDVAGEQNRQCRDVFSSYINQYNASKGK